MPQEFLNLPDCAAPSQDLTGGCVTKTVRVNTLQPSPTGMLQHDLGDTRPAQRLQRWQGTDEHTTLSGIAASDA